MGAVPSVRRQPPPATAQPDQSDADESDETDTTGHRTARGRSEQSAREVSSVSEPATIAAGPTTPKSLQQRRGNSRRGRQTFFHLSDIAGAVVAAATNCS